MTNKKMDIQPAASVEPVAYLIDWPDEPELGHYIAEAPTDAGRCRALVLRDAAPLATQPQPVSGADELPLPVFSKGPWLFRETGQEFSGADLDKAAFAVYGPAQTNVNSKRAEFPDGFVRVEAFNRLQALCDSQAEQLLAIDDAQTQPSGNAGELPTNEEFETLWEEHAGHPADFAAAVLERWGGWRPGALGYGGSLAGQAQPPVSQAPEGERPVLDERATFEAGVPVHETGMIDGRYSFLPTFYKWQGWQARAALATRPQPSSDPEQLPDSLIPATPDLDYLRSMTAGTSLPAMLRGNIVAALRWIEVTQARPQRRPYNPSGSLSEYGVIPESDIAQPSGQTQQDAKPDMYWDAGDPERFAATDLHGAVEYMMDDYADSDMPMDLEFQCAQSMPNVRVRVTARSDADGYTYEVLEAARQEQLP